MLVTLTNLETLNFAKSGGLLPAIVQDQQSSAVLMLGYVSRESLQVSLTRQRVVFFSRSRQELWEKGATSGNHLHLVDVHADCDSDAVLIRALPQGPTCHRGSRSCFGDDTRPANGFLGELDAIVAARRGANAETSYTARLFQEGPLRRAQKLGEEGLETALAGACQDDASLLGESADLLYHLLVLLRGRDLSIAGVISELERRHKNSMHTASQRI